MTPRRRASDQQFWTRVVAACKEQPIVTLLVVAVGLQLVMFALGLLVLNPRAAHNQAGIEAIATQLSESTLSQCRRGNETRPVTIRAYLSIAEGNRARAQAWQGIADAFPDTAPVAMDQVHVNREEARKLTRVAYLVANAQRTVSLHPDSDDLLKRAIVDCEGQFG